MSGLVESVPNFSEGRDPATLAAIGAAAESGGAHVLDSHPDPIHNRAVVSLATVDPEAMVEPLLRACAAAVERIDVRRHDGVHPRLGAADVIPFVQLGEGPATGLVEAAHALGERIWAELRVPVHFYGLAARSPEASRLAAIRAGRVDPDVGEGTHPSAGRACVGVRRQLVAYNILLPGAVLEQAQEIAKALRESSGGLPGVQALIFDLGPVLQLSMNLVDLERTTPAAVRAAAAEEAARRGLQIGPDEVVGLCPAWAAPEAASGRLLEARVAAAAAADGARRAASRAGDEAAAIRARLERESRQIGGMAASPDDLLAGAERAAALRRFLRAAGLLQGDAAALLSFAVPGLRRAVPEASAARHRERVAALDRWLAEEA